MRSFYYRPGKNAMVALFLGVLAIVFGRIAWESGGFILWTLTALFAAGAAQGTLNALNSEPALRYDHDRLWVRTPFGGVVEVAWRDVLHITLEVMTMRYFGVIAVGRTEFVAISCAGGLTGTRRLRLATGSMELPAGGAAGLVQLLQQAQREATGEAGTVAPAASHNQPPVAPREPDANGGSGFDPDAAVARYLAAKQAAGHAGPDAPHQGGFNPPQMPHRPVFGKRAVR